MNRYVIFTKDTQNIIDNIFKISSKIWGNDVDYNSIRILAGNYSAYGSYIAHYLKESKIIEIPVNNFSMLEITKNGIELKKNKMNEFQGLLLHEIGHHVTYYKKTKPWGKIKAGYSTHSNASWCWIAYKGWSYFTNNDVINAEVIAYGVKHNIGTIKEELSSFSPYHPPIDLLITINEHKKKNIKEKKCMYCDNLFTFKRSDSKFCSDKCRVANSRLNVEEYRDRV